MRSMENSLSNFFYHVPIWYVYSVVFIAKIFISFFRWCSMWLLLGWEKNCVLLFLRTTKIVLSLWTAIITIRASNCVDCRPWPFTSTPNSIIILQRCLNNGIKIRLFNWWIEGSFLYFRPRTFYSLSLSLFGYWCSEAYSNNGERKILNSSFMPNAKLNFQQKIKLCRTNGKKNQREREKKHHLCMQSAALRLNQIIDWKVISKPMKL